MVFIPRLIPIYYPTFTMQHDKSDFVHSIGNRLKALRTQKGWSMRKLAEAADVSPSLISQIENGNINPSARSLYSMAGALNVPFDQFFADPSEEKEGLPAESVSDMTPSEIRTQYNGIQPENSTPSALETDLVLQPEARAMIELQGGVIWERLTASAEKNIEFLKTRYEVGATSGNKMSHHAGREFGMVLSGELTIEIGFEYYTLHAGDTIVFDSSRPHRLSNRGEIPVESIWVIWE